ncbi:RsmD family RNA methyltransferase [Klebsiella pneumoniae]|nr:RsmD family RNA methyltransferase [Klebsiella pneumoniae]
MKPNHAGAVKIRIIGGQWRGCKLPVPESPGLRPTTDRVRETLNRLRRPLLTRTARLLCRQRRAGLEALSRYAATTLLEMERGAAQQLQKSATLESGSRQDHHQHPQLPERPAGTPHQIVFADPPFRQGLPEETLRSAGDDSAGHYEFWYVESEVERLTAGAG